MARPPVLVSMLVDSHMKVGIPLGAGSRHKGFSDPLHLKKRDEDIVIKRLGFSFTAQPSL